MVFQKLLELFSTHLVHRNCLIIAITQKILTMTTEANSEVKNTKMNFDQSSRLIIVIITCAKSTILSKLHLFVPILRLTPAIYYDPQGHLISSEDL